MICVPGTARTMPRRPRQPDATPPTGGFMNNRMVIALGLVLATIAAAATAETPVQLAQAPAASPAVAPPAGAAAVFDAVRQRGSIVCGVSSGIAGFGLPDAQGVWRGLDVDVCRAVAAAMFGDPGKVRYVPLSSQQRFTALQSGEVDLLSRTTT